VKKHNISLASYRSLYLIPAGLPPDIEKMKAQLSEQEAEKGTEFERGFDEKLDPVETVLFPTDLENDDDDSRVYSDDPNNMCQLKCNICFNEVKTFGHHVQSCHSLSESAFRMLYPEELFFRKTFHR
jgi:hypothetical protein